MAAPRLIGLRQEKATQRPQLVSAGPEAAWRIVSLLGLGFVIVGTLDLGLAWIPLGLGSPEWEFGTIASTLNGLPVLTMGIALLVASAFVGSQVRTLRALAVAAALLTALLVLCGVLFLTVAPVALRGAPNAVVQSNVMKVVIKGGVLLLVYPILYGWLGFRAWRYARQLAP